jgi:hypothetical protein
MKGLILAGIGKGIADAGQTVSNFMVKDIEDKRKEMLDALREERQAARELARDDRLSEREAERETRKIERETATAEALKKRVAGESVQIESLAADAPIRRDAAAVSRLGAQVEGESPVMEQSEIEKLIRENPQYREVYRKAGLIGEDKMDPRLRAAEDQATAALEIGAHSSVIDAYSKKRRDVLEQIRLDNTATRSEQQHTAQMAAITERGRQFDERKPILQQAADARTTSAGAAVTRANRPPSSGGGSGGDKPATTADMQRQINAANDDIATLLGTTTREMNQKLERTKSRADGGDAQAIAKMKEIQPYLDAKKTLNQRMREFKSPSEDGSTGSPSKPKTGDNKPGESSASSSAVAKPKTQAEFDKLPPGALYVNPKDGKTYSKNDPKK